MNFTSDLTRDLTSYSHKFMSDLTKCITDFQHFASIFVACKAFLMLSHKNFSTYINKDQISTMIPRLARIPWHISCQLISPATSDFHLSPRPQRVSRIHLHLQINRHVKAILHILKEGKVMLV